MNIKVRLSERIGMEDINEILQLTHQSDQRKQELYDLLVGENETLSYQAAWIFTHFSPDENKWLYDKQNELIDKLLTAKHRGRQRLLLVLIYKQPLPNPPRVDLLDFCLERILATQELPGIQSLGIKIAYELCLPIPELKQELKTTLDMMRGELPPAIRCVRKNVLKAMQNNKSLQKIV